MKPALLSILVLLLILSGCTVVSVRERVPASSAGGDKIAVCHKGKKTLYVAPPAVKAHLGHGDYRGVCQ